MKSPTTQLALPDAGVAPLRLLHVVPSYYPAVRYGGPIRSVHALCASLAQRGHEVSVYTTNIDGENNSDVPPSTLPLAGFPLFPHGLGVQKSAKIF